MNFLKFIKVEKKNKVREKSVLFWLVCWKMDESGGDAVDERVRPEYTHAVVK